ncbi:NAD(P)/FAD-dependent oxidoreductase [Dactylosporangium sp. CA-139066]|uniref:NAD(P)/FAD-dependent oxidoreductase n=1 Tax=Dactylosporangium sp. CA-139066 TaxID=3239930 RepID=UPI003D916588
MSELYDVIVIGGGAAGLSGALTLSRARRRVLVLDGGRPRNAPADGVHNYLGREGTPPRELVRIGRDEVGGYGGQVVAGTVTRAVRDGEEFQVETEAAAYRARRLLVASGAADELPGIPGVAEGFGHWVLHCPYCHGWEVQDRRIGVIASGGMAAHQALLWTQWSDDVVLFGNGRSVDGVPEKVHVVEGPVERVEAAGVHLRNGAFVARDALVVQTRVLARAGFLETLGLATTDLVMQDEVVATYVKGDATGRTDVPGVWVAGNVADPMAQVIVAAGAGMKAGAAINMDLLQ